MKLLFVLLLSSAFTFISLPAVAAEKAHYVTMTVEPGSTPDINGKIIVSRASGVSQEILLQRTSQRGYLKRNNEIITETMNKLAALGFKLVSTNVTPVSTNRQHATYIFCKEL